MVGAGFAGYHAARRLSRRLLDLRNDVGMLAEEYDPGTGAAIRRPRLFGRRRND